VLRADCHSSPQNLLTLHRNYHLSREPCEKAESLPEEIIEIGDKIVVFVHFQAWPSGGGQPREGRIADVYTIQHGKVVQMQAYSDPEEARKAVGLSPHH